MQSAESATRVRRRRTRAPRPLHAFGISRSWHSRPSLTVPVTRVCAQTAEFQFAKVPLCSSSLQKFGSPPPRCGAPLASLAFGLLLSPTHLASWLLAPHTLTLHMVRSSTSHMLDGGVDSPMHKRCRCLAPWCDGFGGSGCIMRGCSPDHALTGPWTASASPPSAGPPPRRPRPPPPWTASSSPRPSWRRRWPSWRSP